MAKPVLVAIDDDPNSLTLLQAELARRYGADYDVVCEASASGGEDALRRLAAERRQVAVVLAARASGTNGPGVLAQAGALHPGAKRVLVMSWSTSAPELRRAAALGQTDFWALRPWRSPDEEFLGVVGEALRAWSRINLPPLAAVRVVGERWSARSHEIRDLLRRNAVPHAFYEPGSKEGRALLEQAGVSSGLPVLAMSDGRILVDPDKAEVAAALGVRTRPAEDLYHLVVVGAGPSGLAASVYGSSEGLQTALLEREAIGGQAGTTSLIRNYLGFPRGVSGDELARRAYEQAWLFGAEFIYGNEAVALRPEGPHRVVTLADGSEIVAPAVVLAMGVSYRRLGIPRLEALSGVGVFYGAAVTEAETTSGKDVFVVGGANSAGQAAVHLAKFAKRVTLVVRGPSLADSMSDYLIKELESEPNIEIRYRAEVVDGEGETRLERLVLRDRDSGKIESVPAAAVFVLIGAEPRTEWLPDEIERDRWGFVLTGSDLVRNGRMPDQWRLTRPPMLLETSLPGVFAVGDVRHGSIKRVASAVGEGSVSIRMVHEYLAERRGE